MDANKLRYNRIILLEVLIAHQRQSSQYCRCGWGQLGASHPEHVIEMYEQAALTARQYG